MSKQCSICGIDTIFYIWTSSRNFPREKLVEIINADESTKKSIIKGLEGRPVCFSCYNKLIKNEKI